MPRSLLLRIPELVQIQTAQSMENALCCGGGAGNDITDLLSGPRSPALRLLKIAMDLGADAVVTACPSCK